ncbi:MAG: cobyrinic acid a,c-diamide synthase, partial [Firmicutes bacterium]|nr:cobyrinic acid a,c-diamide synthase [Bacillota bacterium]
TGEAAADPHGTCETAASETGSMAGGEAGATEHPEAAGALEHPEAAGVSNDPPAEGSTNVLPRTTNIIRIAVARDAAFNFIYAASVFALEDAGAELVYFSPLKDHALPEGVSGLYLPGGYPELYGKELSENESMRTSIREAIQGGLPTIAECGGFLYLGETLADADGESWPMAGALPGHGAGTGKLVRFGYGTISCEQESMLFCPGEEVPVHEFHYWDTTAQGEDLTLTKNSNGKRWHFGYAGETIYAGFPHLYLAGGKLAERFTAAARKYAAGSGR